jgi:IclR family transcriptional regulator, KDG regulon repressor
VPRTDTSPEASLGAERAAEVLIRASSAHWTLSELARAMEVERRALGRVVSSLENAGLLGRDVEGRIAPGVELVAVAQRVGAQFDVATLARDVVDELAHATGCTALLHLVHGEHLLPEVIGMPADVIAVSYPTGRAIGLWEGIGRAVLAFRSDEEIRRLGARSPRADFLETIAREREEELAISYGEVVPGITAIGVPVFDASHLVVGVLAVVALDPEAPARYSRLVKQAARRLSDRLAPHALRIGD